MTEDAATAARKLVDYMGLQAGESLVVTADIETDPALTKVIYEAARACSAKPAIIVMPRLPFQGSLADPFIPPGVVGAVANADVWIDLTFPYMAGCHVHDEVTRHGKARYLLGGDMGIGGLLRLFGAVDLDSYFTALRPFEKSLTSHEGAIVRVTDPLGSDISFKLAKPPYEKPRRAEKPGTYLVPGSCTMFPDMETVQGIIRFKSVFHEYFTTLEAPVEVQVDGRIREIRGGGSDRLVLDRSLRRAGGDGYGYMIHFTYGMNPGARATGRSFIEDSRVMGNNAVGMGLPWWVPGGGENHPDAVLSRQSIWVNNHLLIEDGLPVAADLREAAKALAPLHY